MRVVPATELHDVLERVIAEYGGLRPAARVYAARAGITDDAALRWMSYVRAGHHDPFPSVADRFLTSFGRVYDFGGTW